VEKRDNPALADKPVIIGGGRRGVVSTACYVARIKGVKSAMPMFQALKLCPEAVIVKPRMDAYVEASRAIRAMMDDLTPVVEPLSLDEAFMDLSGTQRLHGAPPICSAGTAAIYKIGLAKWVTGCIGWHAVRMRAACHRIPPSKAYPTKQHSTQIPMTPTFLTGTSGAWLKK